VKPLVVVEVLEVLPLVALAEVQLLHTDLGTLLQQQYKEDILLVVDHQKIIVHII
jgi:hypothetical protein